ncbi:MAG: hypothetical protein OEZ59_06080, partial [Deltaproteobacteria bacterium]|nr:hypothetical protein [Deltaproteobacteria bacterium]
MGKTASGNENSMAALAKKLSGRWIFVMVRLQGDFILPCTRELVERIHRSGEYPDDFNVFLRRVLEALAGGDWPAGSYYPG